MPPVALKAKNSLVKAKKEKDIFRGKSELFKRLVSNASAYGEYGCGASTIWVAHNTATIIYSIDTSMEWIKNVKNEVGDRPNQLLTHVDLGDLGEWGRPRSYKYRNNIINYLDGIWKNEFKPDVVLIDGRFRVACLLYSLLNSKPSTQILFDDYLGREHYHLVEEFVTVTETCGDQVLFVVPENFDRISATKELERFMYVME